MQKELKDIPSHFFPLWGVTLNYERGMPEFRQPPEFAEEGVLTLIDGEYSYEQIRKLVAPPLPADSQLSTIRHVEFEDNPPPRAPPPSHHGFEMGNSSYPTPCPWQQTPLAPAQSTGNQIHEQSSGEGSSYDGDIFNPHPDFFQGPYYVYDNSTEPPAMQEIEQTYPRAFLTPSDAATSTPHNVQWNSLCPIGQDQYSLENGPMTSPEIDTRMAELFSLIHSSTPPYDTD